ncbi:hypothetical protein Q7P37_009800 [Cladosporium fusiforme]
MSSPFAFDATRSHHPSDDGFSDDSNFEHLSPEPTAHLAEEQNFYWLGKQVLASRIARIVVRQCAANATPDDLKMEVLRLKAGIPYAARLALITRAGDHSRGEAGHPTRALDFHAYCVAIGTLAASDTEGARRELEVLIEGEGRSDVREPTQSNGSASGGQSVDHGGAEPFVNMGAPFDPQTVHYSMALKEYGDNIGREARYDVERSPTNPSLFSARVHVNGSQYDGLGLEQSRVIGQDIAAISSDLYDSLFLQSLLQHGSGSDIKGAHGLDTMTDIRSRWHHFLDDLCFLCDSKHAGQSVVSIGVEQCMGGVNFWITTAERHRESAEYHLKEILHLLIEYSFERSDRKSTMAEIARRSIERSPDRISEYVKRLERLIPEESISRQDGAQSDEVMIWSRIKATLAEKECDYDLCRAAYDFRYSSLYESLKALIGSRPSDVLSRARHLMARLGHWQKTSMSTVACAPEFLTIIRSAVVRSVQPPRYQKIRLQLDEDLQDLILRVFPNFKGSPMCDALLERIQRADSLIKWFRSANTKTKAKIKPHAEVVMLEYFHMKDMQFINDDKYIACSKPSCYCCALYFRIHPIDAQRRPCHGNVWVKWTLPCWEEPSPDKDFVSGILRRMANTTRDISYASFQDGVRPRKRFESTIGITTARMDSSR